MPNAPEPQNESHFRVVRYYPDFGNGTRIDVLGENLSLEEAHRLQDKNKPVVSHEDVVIEDQNKEGVEAEVLTYRLNSEEDASY